MTRLIDADALKDSIKKNCGVYFDGTCDNRRICALIDNSPTISPYKAIHDELHKGEEE